LGDENLAWQQPFGFYFPSWGSFLEKQSHIQRQAVSIKALSTTTYIKWTEAGSNRRHRPFQGRKIQPENTWKQRV